MARPPLGLLWFSGSIDRYFSDTSLDLAHYRIPHPVIAAGRMFIAAGNTLHGIDIYTGRHLWKTSLPGADGGKGFAGLHRAYDRPPDRNYIAAADCLYVFHEAGCFQLNPQNGETIGEIALPDDLPTKDASRWYEVRLLHDTLVFSVGNTLACLGRQRGELRWKYVGGRNGIAFAASGNRLFAVDYWDPVASRRGHGPADNGGDLVALDAVGGQLLWRRPLKTPPLSEQEAAGEYAASLATLKPVVAYNAKHDIVITTINRRLLSAHRGSDGEPRWTFTTPRDRQTMSLYRIEPPTVLDDVLLHGSIVSSDTIDILTGTPTFHLGSRRGCGRLIGNNYIVTFRDACAAYRDVASMRQTSLLSIRGGCSNAMIPAGGIVVAPDFAHGCVCDFPFFMSCALYHLPTAAEFLSE